MNASRSHRRRLWTTIVVLFTCPLTSTAPPSPPSMQCHVPNTRTSFYATLCFICILCSVSNLSYFDVSVFVWDRQYSVIYLGATTTLSDPCPGGDVRLWVTRKAKLLSPSSRDVRGWWWGKVRVSLPVLELILSSVCPPTRPQRNVTLTNEQVRGWWRG